MIPERFLYAITGPFVLLFLGASAPPGPLALWLTLIGLIAELISLSWFLAASLTPEPATAPTRPKVRP